MHAQCAGINRKELSEISSPAYGDWYCGPCKNNTGAPSELENDALKEEYITFLNCSICTKKVKGESLCCALCRHWVDKKCIGKFSTKIKNGIDNTFKSMNEFYKDQDWFCFECSKNIFPLIGLPDDEFLLSCLEAYNNISPNMREICRTLINLNVLNDDIESGDFKFDEKSILGGIDPDKKTLFLPVIVNIFLTLMI